MEAMVAKDRLVYQAHKDLSVHLDHLVWLEHKVHLG